MYYEKRERKKQVLLYSIILWKCKYVTICSVFILYEIKMENQTKIIFLSNSEFFVCNWEKTFFLALGMGLFYGPKFGWSRALNCVYLNIYNMIIWLLIEWKLKLDLRKPVFRFVTNSYPNQPAQLQRLPRRLKFGL